MKLQTTQNRKTRKPHWARRTSGDGAAETKPAGAKLENPPLSQILKIYAKLAGANLSGATLKPATARKNVNSLKLILRRAGIDPEAADLTDLTPAVIDKWRQSSYKRAGLDFARPNPAKNSSLNATLRQARSVFGARALAEYARRKIRLPKTLEAFMQVADLKPEVRREFTPLSKDIDEQIRTRAAASLDGETGAELPPPEAATMIEMARYAGMTLREILFFRPEWVVETPSGTFINVAEDGEFTTKRCAKNRKIPVDPERLKRWLKTIGKTPLGDPHTPAQSEAYKCACRWLREYMPNRTKKLHELRKMACSDMLSRTGNIFLAARFIGNSIDTTSKYYAGLLNDIKPL